MRCSGRRGFHCLEITQHDELAYFCIRKQIHVNQDNLGQPKKLHNVVPVYRLYISLQRVVHLDSRVYIDANLWKFNQLS